MHGSVCNQVMDGALFASAVQIHVSGILSGSHKDTKLPKPTQISLCICTLKEPSLNFVSSQCARDKSSIARKPEVQSKVFKWLISFQKCNPSDFNFHPSKLTGKIFHLMVYFYFSSLFYIVKCSENRHKINIRPHGGKFYH